MKGLTDAEVMKRMSQAYQNAKTAQKEGKGTGRGVGSSGLIAAEWMSWRDEALARGLVK